jgi:hypothetical protein
MEKKYALFMAQQQVSTQTMIFKKYILKTIKNSPTSPISQNLFKRMKTILRKMQPRPEML